MWTEREFTYDVSYANQTSTTMETETSSDEEDIIGPTTVRELKTGVHVCVTVCVSIMFNAGFLQRRFIY